MELSAAFYAVAIPAVLISAVSKGGLGSGASFVAAPLLALVIEPAQAVGLMLPLLIVMDMTGLRPYWRRWSWPHARQLMLGALPGIALGALLFRSVSPDGIRLMVGTLALGFVAFQLARARGWVRPGAGIATPAWGLGWGGAAGFTSFVGHAGGPPAAVYLLGAGLDKGRFQATTVLVFAWINLVKVPPYLALGMFTADSAKANLILAPVAVAGVLAGVWAHRVIPEALFFRVTYVLLAVTGAKLVFDALT